MSKSDALNELILINTAYYKWLYKGNILGYRDIIRHFRDVLRAAGFTTEEINANWWISVDEREAFNANENSSN